ncbi:hypothetical protein MC885_008109, partial [Smutsia gigantea]
MPGEGEGVGMSPQGSSLSPPCLALPSSQVPPGPAASLMEPAQVFRVHIGISGCWHGVEDKGVCSKQDAAVERAAQVRIPSAHPSTQKADNCDMCGPFLKDILHLEEHEATHPEKIP